MDTQENTTSLESIRARDSHATLGVPMNIPAGSAYDISVILRVIVAMSTEIPPVHDEPYEVLLNQLARYQKDLKDIADRIREVTSYADL